MDTNKHSAETDLESHFEFGKNWEQFAHRIGPERLATAKRELVALLGRDSFQGESWIDIGCGSGIHAVAAAKLGAQVLAIDIDPVSVATTRQLAAKFGVSNLVRPETKSVFDLDGSEEKYDVVYSWGVLHHTGDMNRAIEIASSLVKDEPQANLVLALYRRTKLCGFWRREKRWYRSARPGSQKSVRRFFDMAYGISFRLRGRSFRDFKRNYQSRRGMDYSTDVHDWLGGYPYESIDHEPFVQTLNRLNFRTEKAILRYPGRTPSGIFGSGCDEYVFVRNRVDS